MRHEIREAHKSFNGDKVTIRFYRGEKQVARASVWEDGHSAQASRDASIVAGSGEAKYIDMVIAIVQRLAWDGEPSTTLEIYD